MKGFLIKVWTGIKWVWGWIKAAAAFVVDFVKWCKERGKDDGAA